MNDEPRTSTFPVGPMVAAVGAVLLIVSLFLDWYEVDLEGFTVFEAEWWHFDYKDWKSYRIGNVTLEDLAAGKQP